VGQPKSLAAANAVRDMNPAINIISHENLVSPNSEDIYDDQFWEGQTFITNALDNVKAREYVDGRCVFYEKPLLESGTLGTKCNVQVIVPHITASYTDIKDPENEDHIPMCTLRNFPSLIEHCIEWSRAQFEDEFVQPFAEVAKFLDDREGYLKQQRAAGATVTGKEKAVSDMQKLVQVINDAKTITFDACVQKAVDYFCSCFRDRILQLIFNLPEDYVNPKTGELFWTGAKRFPSALEYDPANELAVEFVKSVANIFACCYGLHAPPDQDLLPEDHEWRSNDFINGSVGSYDIPAFVPTAEAIDLGDSKDEDNDSSSSSDESKDRDGTFEDLLAQISGLDTEGVRVTPADFEKDEDRNFHIDFISAASNLRAANYRIKQASRHKCKMIAGKIIPAIATTTASVCGLVMVEMLKVLQGKGLEAFRDSSNSLGLNMYMLQEPAPAIKAEPGYDHVEMCEVLTYPEDFTKWDKIKVGGGNQLTLGEFMEAFKAETGLTVTFMSHSVSDMEGPQQGKLLYEANSWSPELKELYASKMNSNLLEYVQERYEGAPIDIAPASRTYIELSIGCSNEDEVPHKVPTVIYEHT
jgi:ubiquitin-activating enzyme E1